MLYAFKHPDGTTEASKTKIKSRQRHPSPQHLQLGNRNLLHGQHHAVLADQPDRGRTLQSIDNRDYHEEFLTRGRQFRGSGNGAKQPECLDRPPRTRATASMAYSACSRWPSGENTVSDRSYLDQQRKAALRDFCGDQHRRRTRANLTPTFEFLK